MDLPSTRVDVSTTGGCSSLDSDSRMPSYRVELRIRILGILGIARTSWNSSNSWNYWEFLDT